MIPAETLDQYLEIWGRAVVDDARMIRQLSFPSATPEHRFARRGGVVAPHALLAPDLTGLEIVDQMDRALAQLRVHNEGWYTAVWERYATDGPDELRAQRLRLKVREFRLLVYAGRRWLRGELSGAESAA